MIESSPYFVALIPIFITTLSGWLNSDKLPAWCNALIVAIIDLAISFVYVAMQSKLVGNVWLDTLLVAGACAGLMATVLAPLNKWLVLNLPSPITALLSVFISLQSTSPELPVASQQPKPLEVVRTNTTRNSDSMER